jgi:hypothetical protein
VTSVDQVSFKHEGETEDGMALGRIVLVDREAEREALAAAGIESDGRAVGVPFDFHDRGDKGVVEIWGTRKEANALGRFFGVEVHES